MVATKSKTEEVASFKPSDAAEGGGLINNFTGTWKDSKFVVWTREGYPDSPAFNPVLVLEDGEEVINQYWSCGSLDNWIPSKDGKKLVRVGTVATLSKTCNFIILMNSLVEAGFPEKDLSDDVSLFDGMVTGFIRVPAPERKGLAPRKPRADGKIYMQEILVVDSLIKLPGEAKGKSSSKYVADQSDETTEKAVETVAKVLKVNPKGIEKNKLAGSAFTLLKKEGVVMTEVNAIAQLLRKDAFLDNPPMTDEGPAWEYERGIVSPV